MEKKNHVNEVDAGCGKRRAGQGFVIRRDQRERRQVLKRGLSGEGEKGESRLKPPHYGTDRGSTNRRSGL